ncbi:MAG: efflux RND transporter periplasmic adaptor subunit [Telmatospirillum sp.]|nr:efflux RND transporter periplasmic adaptor subunit [Telmatospirillum sp.]
MDDRNELLEGLRLDRRPAGTKGRGPGRFVAIGLGALALAAVGVGAVLLWPPAAVPVAYAEVRAPDKAAGAGATASSLDASGYVVARRQATVAAKITARVTEILIEEGLHVKSGQVMARLDDSNTLAALAQARAQLAQAEANRSAARTALRDEEPIFRRREGLSRQGWVSGADLDEERAKYDAALEALSVAEKTLDVARAALAVAERNQEDTIVRAPYDGVITVKAAQPGEVVSPLSAGGGFTRTGIGTLVDMDSLEVEVDVSENYIDRVRPNQDAVVRLNAYPDWSIPAYVIAIIPTADRSKATVKVRIGFRKKDDRILPEMGARVSFMAAGGDAGLNGVQKRQGFLVPLGAVSGQGDTAAVFVVRDDHVERRPVALGARDGQSQTVLSGLNAGETVAVGDLSLLRDGVRVVRSGGG